MAAFNNMAYSETRTEGGHFYHFTGPCRVTGKQWTVAVPGEELFQYRQGKLIQDAMPSVSTEDREFLVTQISPLGWQRLYPNEK